ncbi:hypothetical protein K2173_009118 [Erythroxylum novogranatense]|uniref:Fe2OG dioxygenase domain-containing protein n=1 Tax=Erythroxylum novogranatense TaxID=1862640 RepID=A0AAV8TF96_9ROSI|nr:hypothetical protein K2173_009118 [Erythroxylum novogranatense]
MSSTVESVSQPSQASIQPLAKFGCIKTLAEKPGLSSIPPTYTFTKNPDPISDPEESLPVVDFSLLSGNPDEHNKVIYQLGKACQEYGFFMVVNHGVPESLVKAMISSCEMFFDLTEEEKREYEGKDVMDPIRCGTSFNTSVEKVLFWRDYLKLFIRPEFHSVDKPAGFRELLLEYSKRIGEMGMELLKGITESLGLEACYIEKALNMENSFHILVANLYPRCPQPERAMGMPPHSDFGLLTLLTQNGVGGLQLLHNDKWINVNPIPNSFVINIGDHLEILSNGKYKSVLHRAVVNNAATRLSLAVGIGPPLDAVVSPAPDLTDAESNPPAYIGMKYCEYIRLQQTNQLKGKSCLDKIRIPKI